MQSIISPAVNFSALMQTIIVLMSLKSYEFKFDRTTNMHDSRVFFLDKPNNDPLKIGNFFRKVKCQFTNI